MEMVKPVVEAIVTRSMRAGVTAKVAVLLAGGHGDLVDYKGGSRR